MYNFLYKKGGQKLFVFDDYGQMGILIEDGRDCVSINLDQEGLDALRNYLDDLETEV